MKKLAAFLVLLVGIGAWAGIQTGPQPDGSGGGGAGSFSSITLSVGIKGDTSGIDVAPGYVGEFSETNKTYAARITANSSVVSPSDVATISLTAGDWDVEGNINAEPRGITDGFFYGMIDTNLVATQLGTGKEVAQNLPTNSSAEASVTIPRRRFNFTTTTTAHLIVAASFNTNGGGASSVKCWGTINARRVR